MSAVNSVTLVGRLMNDVRVFENQDGSKSVVGRIAVKRDFLNTVDGEKVRKSDFFNFRHRVAAKTDGIGSWAKTGEGDLVALDAELRSPEAKPGEQIQYGKVDIELQAYPTFLESREVTEGRRAKKQAAAAQAAQAAPTEAAQAAPVAQAAPQGQQEWVEPAQAAPEGGYGTEPFMG